MKQFRLSTLMLLVVIAALCVALVVQHNRAAQREAELRTALNSHNSIYLYMNSSKNDKRIVPLPLYSRRSNTIRIKG